MSKRQRCCAASLCRNHEETTDSQGICKRRGKRVRSGQAVGTDCGMVVCCEECREIHRLLCEVRMTDVAFLHRSSHYEECRELHRLQCQVRRADVAVLGRSSRTVILDFRRQVEE